MYTIVSCIRNYMYTLDGTRTRNLWIRSPMRYPLRHKSFMNNKRFGAAVARWAHNPKVRGSKPRIAKHVRIYFSCVRVCDINSELLWRNG